jgi:hypothetical protein
MSAAPGAVPSLQWRCAYGPSRPSGNRRKRRVYSCPWRKREAHTKDTKEAYQSLLTARKKERGEPTRVSPGTVQAALN